MYTGLRPGEKMFEELSAVGENYVPTRHEKVVRTHNGARGVKDPCLLWESVQELIRLAGKGNVARMREKLKEIVPEYGAAPDTDAGR